MAEGNGCALLPLVCRTRAGAQRNPVEVVSPLPVSSWLFNSIDSKSPALQLPFISTPMGLLLAAEAGYD
jgi:hypothetical protein